MSSVHSPRISSWQHTIVVTSRAQKMALWGFLVTLLPNDMAVCFNHADSFELDHFDQNSQPIFWLKVNKDAVSAASILEYDRYEPRLGARSCHRYLEYLKISTYYVNHVLLVILRLIGTFKNVFKILIVQIPC